MIDQIKLMCFFGPESTGKSFLASKLAERYHTSFVPEVSRELIAGNTFNREDIIAIGREQTKRVFTQAKAAHRILFCDTDLITTQIYSREYLKVVPPVLYEFEKMVEYDLYFLFDIDVPWVGDGVRDLGSDENRTRMYGVFRNELDRRGIRYISVRGTWEQREKSVTQAVDLILSR
jgi:HTH-type transcriptional regulator, transcriptional repressor of NAD biosynthesis genes